MTRPIEILSDLVLAPGPPGQEKAVRDIMIHHLNSPYEVDAKGNLLVNLSPEHPRIIVTAHMDEIALMVQEVDYDGVIRVRPMGGLHAWKLGEGPVQILADNSTIDAVLSFGSVHTEDPASVACQAEHRGIEFDLASVFTGLDLDQLNEAGVRPGTRIVIHPQRRNLFRFQNHISGYFLDDRADLVSWLISLNQCKDLDFPVLFVATTSEEVGGEGAQYLLHKFQPDICIALELGPITTDNPAELSPWPTVWVADSYAASSPEDNEMISRVAAQIGMDVQFQALSRGGSDSSCGASRGLCARPITLGLPMLNTHGFEVICEGAMENLARLTTAVIAELCGSSKP